MNTYLRQTANSSSSSSNNIVTTEQMHDFLKDKQAWEHAIALYQGPDPLDHWYNYVCWYESYGHGDPENRYRETLLNCLSIFEHNEYYKQDVRMLRLWLKYIDMQPNPCHFYHALYQRGVARQIALFYISWGGYYESLQALKEAESVYNLGFQEKAQPYTDLQHALAKLMYARAALQQQQQQQQQQKTLQEQQVTYQNNLHGHLQPQQQANTYQRAQLSYAVQQPQQQQQLQQVVILNEAQQQQQTQSQYNSEEQSTTYHTVHLQQQVQQQQHHHYHTPHTHSQQIHQHHQTLDQQQHIHMHHQQHEQQQSSHSHIHIVHHQQQTQQHFIAQNSQQIATEQDINEQQKLENNQQQQQQTHYAADAETQQQQTQTLNGSVHYQEEIATATEPPAKLQQEIPDIRLPKRFVNYARNNHETWKPALCLEEPPDAMRNCHYAKNQVYPAAAGVEFSPEELRLMKYQNNAESTTESAAVESSMESVETSNDNVQRQPETNNGASPAYSSSSSDKEDHYGFSEREDDTHEESCDDNYEDEQEGAELEEEEEDLEYEEEAEDTHQVQQQTQQTTVKYNNYNEPADEQIEASTIHLGNNKTIKIKFKKQSCSNGGNGASGSNYSAYKIESIYQQEISAPKTPPSSVYERRNGHTFHPYLLGQTSTPKISSSLKRHKSKLKRASHDDEFPQTYCNNSNSSTVERETLATTNERNHVASTAAISSATDNAVQNANFNDNANFSFCSAVTLDNSNCSISSAVGRLNFRDNSALGLANTQFNCTTNNSTITANKTGASAVEISTYQENSYFATQYDSEAKERRLQKALETIERHLSKDVIDPFNSELCRAFLTKLDFPGPEDNEEGTQSNYKVIQTPLPKIANTKVLHLADGVNFNIDKEVGRGSYGSVYKATDVNNGTTVALKYQKPPNSWEIYICDQVLKRIKLPSVLPGLMDISTAIIAPNASVIATEFSPFGSLLDINNKIRQATTKVMHESLVMHFSTQICNIVHHLHQQKIIHADIKPDNFLLMRVPSTELHYPSLRLIDFGCAIDMTLFPDCDNTKFRKVIQTDGFTCIEMQEGRPWSYETDLFCVAGTVHVMLFGEYMQAQKRAGSWDIKQKLPRYLKKHIWTHFFSDMLNIKSILPNLHDMGRIFAEEVSRMDSELQKQIRTLSNILYRR